MRLLLKRGDAVELGDSLFAAREAAEIRTGADKDHLQGER